jgi:hypothetical protein
MDLKVILPVLTLILGWFLRELGTRFGESRNLKRAMNRALSELLDLHLVVTINQQIIEEYRVRAQGSLDSEMGVRKALSTLLANSSTAIANYNSAAAEVAGEDPVLGSELRGLSRRLEHVIEIITEIADHETLTGHRVSLLDKAVESWRKNIEDCALMLGKCSGRRAEAKIRHHLAKPRDLMDTPVEAMYEKDSRASISRMISPPS